MSHHNYREEPNVRFSPDKTLVIFTSNMFGPSYVFGVEVAKADPSAADVAVHARPGAPVQSRRTDINARRPSGPSDSALTAFCIAGLYL